MYKPTVNKDDFLIHQYTNRSDFVFLVCIWWELRAMFSNKRAVIGPLSGPSSGENKSSSS